jgi:hypothetical protein
LKDRRLKRNQWSVNITLDLMYNEEFTKMQTEGLAREDTHAKVHFFLSTAALSNCNIGEAMKVMAIGTLKPLSQEQREQYLPKEVPATLQFYLDGKMEQFWMRNKEAGVIFLMTVDSVEEADKLLKSLPLSQANLLTFELMPIGPLLPLGMLMKAK